MPSGMRGEDMDMIFQWIRSLVCYLILMTMVVNLIPEKKYENYLRLFAGIIFLMLVFAPFGNLNGVEEQVAEAFSRMTFQNEAKILKREIEDIDGARMTKLVEHYADAIELDLERMAKELGWECKQVAIQLDEELESGTFGRVTAVEMTVSDRKKYDPDTEETILKTEHMAVVEKEARLEKEMKKELAARIGAYYGVEEGNITIHVEDE